MPGYYLIGIVTSVFWITLFSVLIGTRELSRPVKFFLPLGLSSLFSLHDGQHAAESLGLRGAPGRSNALHRGLLRERPDHHEVHPTACCPTSTRTSSCTSASRAERSRAALPLGVSRARRLEQRASSVMIPALTKSSPFLAPKDAASSGKRELGDPHRPRPTHLRDYRPAPAGDVCLTPLHLLSGPKSRNLWRWTSKATKKLPARSSEIRC